MTRFLICAGAIDGLLAVALAAFAAHAGPNLLDAPHLAMLRSGVEMQAWHAPALLFAGLWAERQGRLAGWAGVLIAIGLLLFCIGVYAAAAGTHLGIVAPTGGWAIMIGWLLLAISALRRLPPR